VLTIIKCYGVIAFCFLAFAYTANVTTTFREESTYGQRLADAARAQGAWERYVALNHDWSPGAWCMLPPEPSALRSSWANEAQAALLDALQTHDERAITYLYSREAAWWSLDTLREQYPQASSR